MDRSWLRADRRTKEIKIGVEDLLKFAFEKGYTEEKISCPCLKCAHSKSWNAQEVKNHFFQYGFDETYTRWIWHGESNLRDNPLPDDTDTSKSVNEFPTIMDQANDENNDISSDSSDFINHIKGEHQPFYLGCESYTKLKALVKLYNMKVKHGMGYEKIHACPNDCLLYRGQRDEDETTCRICKATRWKLNRKGEELEGVPAKVLWYVPLIPRLRSLFNTPKIAKYMTWHDTKRLEDGKMRHPDDSETWKDVDKKWPDFASESRNLRLALSADGFNPFHGNRTDHSIWPVLLSIYNLPHWLCMKRGHVLDVMHIEKSICEAMLGTLLNIPGKIKDRESIRLDMAEMGIRTELSPKTTGKKEKVSLASWNLSHGEKKTVCSSFLQMKLSDGFCSNIKNLVNMENLRLVGMKCHDCHTILHHLLPISIRSVLQKQARCTIIRFCLFFKAICSKIIDVEKLEKMQAQLVEILCQLEKHFPPSFFDVMIHLSIHLVREVKLCGPIFLRWMYPFERYMKVFKGYVQNPAYPQGCIAEAYIAEEAVECLAYVGLSISLKLHY
ncbi:uncharacterized protein LOC141714210 [Apium graveolens]|uniref:uncharacterized protein LOC141714210 n=1 Tax=Apium graveolens TaxID=4045 RepID=UPI003D793316